ncbi:MAG: PKD domain-containing protein [Gemmatimonadaceae bacterium]|nr:PKD domain-containing protein [Gemmatimonadaceae bacterium]
MSRTVLIAVLLVAALLGGCADGVGPFSPTPAPDSLVVAAVRPGVNRLTWAQVKDADIAQYIVERRVSFNGPFVEVARISEPNLGPLSWIDTDVLPETVYGYRVFSLTLLGDKSGPSVTGGTLTPPRPGITVATNSSATVSEALDPDGYTLELMGPDTVRATIGVAATRSFTPLKIGRYSVALSGVIDRCSITGTGTREVVVTDTSASTIVPVSFSVTCRDPSRGDLGVTLAVTGAELDNAFTLDILGQAADTTLPPSQRVYSAKRNVNGGANRNDFSNLRPGEYTVTLEDVAANCTREGTAQRTVTVTKLTVATVNYGIVCAGPGGVAPPPSTAPFVWRNRWTPKTAGSNATVVLESTLDLTARPGRVVQGAQASLFYDPAVLRYVSRTPGQLENLTANTSIPGQINMLAATETPLSGVVSLARFTFTVIGAAGTKSLTTTTTVRAGSPAPFQDSVRVVEDTFTVGTGSGTVANQPPVARAGGPYTGTAGTALTLSGAGSSDADGTIATYAWTFGDNTTGTGVSPAKTYPTAGTYTATLTVTDDKGATATSSSQVTITPGGGAAAPVAVANGPYTTTVGVPVTLSSAGSTNATSFSWNLGNGQNATGASPSVTYSVAGTFSVTLTATGAGGQTSTSTTSMVVNAAAPPPPPPSPSTLEWKSLFGPLDVSNNTVSITLLYDTRVNITETPGAEALEKFSVDSIKWDPSVLQFSSISLGPNIVGSSNQVGATAGRLGLNGTISGAQQQGLITIATIRLRMVGSPNATTSTKTFLGALLGPSSTNFYSYNSKTTIIEGQFTVP